ncbi:Uncharacterised protein [marine metagenome]
MCRPLPLSVANGFAIKVAAIPWLRAVPLISSLSKITLSAMWSAGPCAIVTSNCPTPASAVTLKWPSPITSALLVISLKNASKLSNSLRESISVLDKRRPVFGFNGGVKLPPSSSKKNSNSHAAITCHPRASKLSRTLASATRGSPAKGAPPSCCMVRRSRCASPETQGNGIKSLLADAIIPSWSPLSNTSGEPSMSEPKMSKFRADRGMRISLPAKEAATRFPLN